MVPESRRAAAVRPPDEGAQWRKNRGEIVARGFAELTDEQIAEMNYDLRRLGKETFFNYLINR